MANSGEIVAKAWEEAMAKMDLGRDLFFHNLFTSVKSSPLTARQRKNLERRIKRNEARFKRSTLKKLAKFRGRIVKVEGDMYDPVLIYPDGRRLRLTEFFWEKK